jgi:hypothetical protein
VSDVVHLRGEGGAVFEMTLPLSPNVQARFDAGAIVRVNQDGSPYEEPQQRRRRPKADPAESPAGD